MTIDREEGISHNHVITGPTGSIRGHRHRVIRSIQKIGYLSSARSSAAVVKAKSSSCSFSSAASDTESESSSSSFSDVALSITTSCSSGNCSHASSCPSSDSCSSAVISFEAEDTDVIHSLRDKWQRKTKTQASSRKGNQIHDESLSSSLSSSSDKDSGCISRNEGHASSTSCTPTTDVHDGEEEENDHVILYTTSIGVIRSTFEESNKLRAILDQNFIRFEERDLFLDESFRSELKHKFALHHIRVPCVFVNGNFFGSMEEIEAMNEAGILRHILPSLVVGSCDDQDDPLAITDAITKTKKYIIDRKKVCGGCGGARFIPCTKCNGSTKSCVLRFPAPGKNSLISLKCSHCSRGTGLIRCPLCFPATNATRANQTEARKS